MLEDPAGSTQTWADHLANTWGFAGQKLVETTTGGDAAYDGPFYRLRSPGERAGKLDIPVVIQGGWWDIFQRGEPLLYEQLTKSPNKKLFMSPHYHVSDGPPMEDPDLKDKWFDRWLQGARNGVEKTPSVNLYPIGGDAWEHHSTWPLRDVTYTPAYLGDGKTLGFTRARPGRRDRAPLLPASSPCSRMTTQWTAGLAQGPCETDNRTWEASGITYTSEPLEQDLKLTGPVVANVWAELTSKDATLVSVLSDVAPSGESNQITAGFLLASQRAVDPARSTYDRNGTLIRPFHPFTRASQQPVTPNDPALYQIEIYPTSAIFRKGDRIRLTIGSADTPATAPSLPVARRQPRRRDPGPARRSLRIARAAPGRARLGPLSRGYTRGVPVHTQGSLLDDRYRVIRHLGSGGMASVLLCEDERLGRQVAVKRLHADSPVDVERRFKREAKLGASLNHPNVVSVFDTATDDEGVLIVMEYVDGHPLSQLVRHGPLRPEEVCRIVSDIGDALDHAHAQGVVHRDVKPGNVLIRDDGVTKLADLGIATAADDTRITRSGIVLGTAAYMAPEQLDGRGATAASDIYALAAVAFEALGGRKPREGKTPMQIAHSLATQGPPDLREAWAEGAGGRRAGAQARNGARAGGPAGLGRRARPRADGGAPRRAEDRPDTALHAPAAGDPAAASADPRGPDRRIAAALHGGPLALTAARQASRRRDRPYARLHRPGDRGRRGSGPLGRR